MLNMQNLCARENPSYARVGIYLHHVARAPSPAIRPTTLKIAKGSALFPDVAALLSTYGRSPRPRACPCRDGSLTRPCRAKARLLLGRSRLPAVPPKCFLFTPERAPRSRGTSAQFARCPRFEYVLWTQTWVKKTLT